MRVLGRLVLVQVACLILMLALAPLAAVVLLGAPGLGALLADPSMVAAALRSMLLGEAGTAIGWPAGLLAALAIWGRPPALRRLVLGCALLILVAPPSVFAAGLVRLANGAGVAGAHVLALLAAHAAPAAAIVALVMTGALNQLDPRLRHSAATCGATAGQTWRLVLFPALAMPLAVAAAAGFAVSLGRAGLDARLAPLHHPTLAGLLDAAWRQADVAAAPEALLLAMLATAPLLGVGLLAVLRTKV